MKILQITDLHLVAPGDLIHGVDPWKRLDACLSEISRHHLDAELLVITGDLADDCADEAYRALVPRLQTVGLPYRLLMGNHDSRPGFLAAFPDAPVDADGFVQSVLDVAHARLIFLDTLHDGHITGRLCATRLRWLELRLQEVPGRPVLLFMHHPPFGIGQPSLDRYVMEPDSAAALAALVKAHGDVRQILAGHVHRPVHGIWNGVPVTTLPATSLQMPFDLAAHTVGPVDEPPAYGVILLGAEHVIFHLRQLVRGEIT